MPTNEVLPINLLPQDAEVQLEKILASSIFVKSERLTRFLRFTVRTTLEGNSAAVKESVLAVEVFDRDTMYDPRVDSVVRVQASRLRLKLKEYYEGEGCRDPIEITYPRGTYVPVFREREVGSDSSEAKPAAYHQLRQFNRWRFLAYAALWILSLLAAHLLMASGGQHSILSAPRVLAAPTSTPITGAVRHNTARPAKNARPKAESVNGISIQSCQAS